jgi:hypothetical protein
MRTFWKVAAWSLVALVIASYEALSWYGATLWGMDPLRLLAADIPIFAIFGALIFVVYLFIQALKQRPRKD